MLSNRGSGFGIVASRPNQLLSSVGPRKEGEMPAGRQRKGRSQEILRSPGIAGEQGLLRRPLVATGGDRRLDHETVRTLEL